jgi:hypothetical protein
MITSLFKAKKPLPVAVPVGVVGKGRAVHAFPQGKRGQVDRSAQRIVHHVHGYPDQAEIL